MLMRNVEELRTRYLDIIYEASFQKEYAQLLQDYVGRPTPLYFAERLSRLYNTRLVFKTRRPVPYRRA
jgi:tryptophan synthase beta chain